MPTPLNISDASDLIDKAIDKIWLKGSEAESRVFEQYYNVETGVSDYYLKDSSLSGLGYAGRIVENAAVTAASPVQGYDKTYTQVNFGILINFTKAMWLRIATVISNYYNKCCKLQETPKRRKLKSLALTENLQPN